MLYRSYITLVEFPREKEAKKNGENCLLRRRVLLHATITCQTLLLPFFTFTINTHHLPRAKLQLGPAQEHLHYLDKASTLPFLYRTNWLECRGLERLLRCWAVSLVHREQWTGTSGKREEKVYTIMIKSRYYKIKSLVSASITPTKQPVNRSISYWINQWPALTSIRTTSRANHAKYAKILKATHRPKRWLYSRQIQKVG